MTKRRKSTRNTYPKPDHQKDSPFGGFPPPLLYAIIRENYRELPSPQAGNFDPLSYNPTQIPYYLLHTAGCETNNNQSKRDVESVY